MGWLLCPERRLFLASLTLATSPISLNTVQGFLKHCCCNEAGHGPSAGLLDLNPSYVPSTQQLWQNGPTEISSLRVFACHGSHVFSSVPCASMPSCARADYVGIERDNLNGLPTEEASHLPLLTQTMIELRSAAYGPNHFAADWFPCPCSAPDGPHCGEKPAKQFRRWAGGSGPRTIVFADPLAMQFR